MSRASHDLTQLLQGSTIQSSERAEAICSIVYAELRRIAARQLRRERANHTLQPTALVNEAWIKLCQGSPSNQWASRAHFLAFAARVMRHILVDHGRRRQSAKRGLAVPILSLEDGQVKAEHADENSLVSTLAIDGALEKLKRVDERQAQVVELRFFGGMSDEEVGEVLGVTSRTVRRDWLIAKAWLHGELKSIGKEAWLVEGPSR